MKKLILIVFVMVIIPFTHAQILDEDFDSYNFMDVPTGWTISEGSSYVWDMEFTSFPNSLLLIVDGFDFPPIVETIIATPDVVVDVNTLILTFKGKAEPWVDVFDLEIGTMSDPNDPLSFELFETKTLTAGWEEYTVNFSTYAGTNTYIAFRYVGGLPEMGYAYIDDVLIEVYIAPSCPSPTALNTPSIGETTTTIAWTAPIPAPLNGYEYHVSTVNTPPAGSGTSTANTSVNLTSLTGATQYYYWVRAMCDGDESSWVASNFVTECSSNPLSLPFFENFETTSPTINCWSIIDDGGDGTWTLSTNESNSGSRSAYHGFDFNAGGRYITPLIALPATSQIKLTFYSLVYDQLTGMNRVLISTNNGLTYSQIWSESSNQPSFWEMKEIDISSYAGNNVRLAFQYDVAMFSHEWYIDDIRIELNQNTWTGASSTNWHTASNWTGGVPVSGDNVIIPNVANKPIISTYMPPLGAIATCNNLTIQSNSSLTIMPGAALTVNGNLINSGNLFMKSVDHGGIPNQGYDASLIVQGNTLGGGNYRIERYLSPEMWHFISSPITLAKTSLYSGIWLRRYNTAQNEWGEYITSPYIDVLPGVGFNAWAKVDPVTITYVGKINNVTITPTISNLGEGFNLIGNPFPSAIDWNAASGWTKTNIAATTYIISNGQWQYWNGLTWLNDGSQYIALGQGYFVQATAPGASIAMGKAIRLHNNVAFKNDKEEIPGLIRISVTGNGYTDETVVFVAEDANIEYDYNYDAMKLYNLSASPQLYTKKLDKKTAIHAFSNSEQLNGMPLYLEVSDKVTYTLRFTHTFQDCIPLVKDIVTNTIISADDTYSFIMSPTDNPHRFEFLRNTTDISSNTSEKPVIWMYDNILNIDNLSNEKLISVELYDILGKHVMSTVSQYNIVLSHFTSGLYIVKVTTDKQTITRKITIQ